MAEPLQIRSLRAVKARLSAIQVADGYLTDAGDSVYFGPQVHSGDDCPAINVIDGGDEPLAKADGSSRSMNIRQTVYVDIYATEYDDEEEDRIAVSELRADAKQALLDYENQNLDDTDGELGILIYGGSLPNYDNENSDVESMRITIFIDNKEGFGDPYATR